MKALVLGSNGQVGTCLQKVVQQQALNENFVFKEREELSINDHNNLRKVLTEEEFDFVVNCAAYTKVDQAEREQSLCYQVNAESVLELANICAETNTFLIHFSTDYVFDGEKPGYYSEDDSCNPINTYGASKRRGEEFIINSSCPFIIIRTSWVYAKSGSNFVNTILRLANEGKDELKIISDQKGSPTYAMDLAEFVIKIIKDKGLYSKQGLYHYTGKGVTSWYEFALEIKKNWELDLQVDAIETKEYKTEAKRPLNSALCKKKVIETFDIELKDWKNSLKEMKNE